jgi:PmbA protein
LASALVDTASRVVELARRHGAEQCDVFAVAFDESNVTVRKGEVEKLIEAGSRSLGLRVINGGRTAVCSTSDLGADSLDHLAREAVELANISAPDEYSGLPDAALFARPTPDRLQLFDERLGALTTDEKLAMALECESAALAHDPRITNTDGASLSTRAGEVALVNSLGFAASYPATTISLSAQVMADDADGKKRNAFWYASERSLHRMPAPAEIGRIAAQRAVDQLGARKVGTRQVPVVFEPMMAAGLLRDVAAAANGSALYRGATFLAGRAGELLASPLFTLLDDPTEPGRAGSRPFDAEGVAARRTALFEDGVFCGFLFDAYTGRRMGAASTGSAQRSVETLPFPGASNLVLRPGPSSAEDVIAGVQDGLYLTSVMGPGYNPTTGDYSRGAGGFWIENGRVAFPVTEINISGRMAEMLAAVDAVASDLTWFGNCAAATLRVSLMTVSGL